MNVAENDRLSRLFHRYRSACPEVEPSTHFMPGMWREIDARRGFLSRLRVYSRSLATVAASVCLALGAYEFTVLASRDAIYERTYVEALNDDDSTETLAFADVVHTEHPGAPTLFTVK